MTQHVDISFQKKKKYISTGEINNKHSNYTGQYN